MRAATVVVFLAGCVLPAYGRTTVIRQLGTAPLLGPSSSTAMMREHVEQNQSILRQAALKSGLTAAQFEQLNQAIATSHVQWVTVPRHLTVMTWRSGKHVYVIRDVKIPPQVRGWEVDLKQRHTTLAVYLPAACGNLSYVRRARAVAVASHPAKTKTVAAIVMPTSTSPSPLTPAAVPVAPAATAVVAPESQPAALAEAPASSAGSGHSPIGEIVAAAGAIAGGIALLGGGGGGGGGAGPCSP